MKSSLSPSKNFGYFLIAATMATLLLANSRARAQTVPCVETNGVKYVQWPNLFGGLDVWDSSSRLPQVTDGPWWLADDFVCTNTGAITDIHLWGSWQNDQALPGTITFQLYLLDDVATNAANPFSHPGTNVLWHQTFDPNFYAENIWTNNASESFLDPGPPQMFGGDSVVWYYCFYPTNLNQYGTPGVPKTYWLAAFAELPTGKTNMFGWKSTTNVQHDISVHAPWRDYGVPPTNGFDWQPNYQFPGSQGAFDLAFKLTTPTNAIPQTPCPETNGVKVLFPPQTSYGGLDVKDGRQSIVLADDFPCTSQGQITDIHMWGSWSNNVHGTITNFWLGIYNDVPAYTNYANGTVYPSHPGTNLLWSQSFPAGQFYETEVYYPNPYEYFWDPTSGTLSFETNVWYYCFYPTNPFVQQGSLFHPTNYWLAARAQLLPGEGTYYGWKTSISNYNDAAVWGTVGADGLPQGNWLSMTNPITQGPVNLSFKLTTTTNIQTCCPEGPLKYAQYPNIINGIDVDASANNGWVLADDFPCTNTGPVTDIHLWGSWWYDQVDYNASFTLTIWSDVPASPIGGTYSHPGMVLWSQTFAPSNYILCPALTLPEGFYDPTATGPVNQIGNSSQLYYLCFYPTNPFVQQGTTAQPTNYWLSVSMENGTAGSQLLFGWKTSTNAYNDAAVFASGAGLYPPPTAWNPMSDPNFKSLNMAFKITTSTNCVVSVTCSSLTNKTVPCGAAVTFDPPIVSKPPCCPAPTVLFSAVTNNIGPCSETVVGTWVVLDCSFNTVGICTQTVNVVDSNAPILSNCGSNLTVQCGSAWSFATPTAQYVCSGSNAFVGILSSNVVSSGPCGTTNTIVWSATNQCSGAYSTCTQIVILVDTIPPVFTSFPTNLVAYTCDTNIAVFWSVTATDACSSVTITSTVPSGFSFPAHSTNTVTVTASDACGNTNTASFSVTVRRLVLDRVFITHIATNKVVLTWTNGILQSATNVLGPYVDLFGATSPFTNLTLPPPPTNQFYRLRCN